MSFYFTRIIFSLQEKLLFIRGFLGLLFLSDKEFCLIYVELTGEREVLIEANSILAVIFYEF